MAFCEECGARLSDGVKFCEECGAKVADEANLRESHKDTIVPSESDSCLDVPSTIDDLESVDFLQRWKEFAKDSAGELGIIITRENKLLSQFGDGDRELLRSVLEEYIDNAKARGVKYLYCNLDDCTLLGKYYYFL